MKGEDFSRVILWLTHRAANPFREIFLDWSPPCNRRRLAHKAEEQVQFLARRWPESADFLGPMSRATIDDQKDFAPGVLDQTVPEFDLVFDEG